jgi:ABC-type nitrate/sulfonate/bicarbonate transport system permease component
VISGLFRLGEDLVDSTMRMLRTVPNIAQTPLFTVWFGIGEAPKVALIALATVFPLYLNVYVSIRNVDQSWSKWRAGSAFRRSRPSHYGRGPRAVAACRSGAP